MKNIIALLAFAACGLMAQTSATTTIDFAHRLTHDGYRFSTVYSTSMGIGTNTNICFATTNIRAFRVAGGAPKFHIRYFIMSESTMQYTFAEAPTLVGVGNSNLTAINKNRQSTITALANLFVHTNATAGTVLDAGNIGTNGAITAMSGDYSGWNEYILKTNTIYNLNIISGAPANKISVVLDWYEIR